MELKTVVEVDVLKNYTTVADVDVLKNEKTIAYVELHPLSDDEDDVVIVISSVGEDDDTKSVTNTNSATIDVHVDVEQLAGATTAKLDRIWVDLVRKEIKSLLDIIDAVEHRIETFSNVVEGLMKLVLQNMKDTTNWMERLEPYFTQ
ncbi:hypothetical protein Tco_0002137 [Tanacetum coccineum]